MNCNGASLQRRSTIDPPSEIEARLFVDTGRETKIVVAEQTRTGAVVARPIVDAVIATIKRDEIGLMIVDPFVASHRVIENDNPAIELVAATWAEIADDHRLRSRARAPCAQDERSRDHRRRRPRRIGAACEGPFGARP